MAEGSGYEDTAQGPANSLKDTAEMYGQRLRARRNFRQGGVLYRVRQFFYRKLCDSAERRKFVAQSVADGCFRRVAGNVAEHQDKQFPVGQAVGTKGERRLL